MLDPYTTARVETERLLVTARIEAEVKERMKDLPPCHDWWHIHRVRNLGAHIARKEGADRFIVDLSLLLHNVDDHKFNGGDKDACVRTARDIMRRSGLKSSMVELEVCENIECMPFSKGRPMRMLSGKVAQDADRLDSMGAIGVARTFTTGCHLGQALFAPGEPPHTLGHFGAKLFQLRDRMNTFTGWQLAQRRHDIMEKFAHDFVKEWFIEME